MALFSAWSLWGWCSGLSYLHNWLFKDTTTSFLPSLVLASMLYYLAGKESTCTLSTSRTSPNTCFKKGTPLHFHKCSQLWALSIFAHTHINTEAITNRPSGLQDRKHFFPKYKVTSDIYLLNLLTDQYVMSAHSSAFREHHNLIQVNYPLKIISLATSVP